VAGRASASQHIYYRFSSPLGFILAPVLPLFPFLSFAVSGFWLHLGEIEIERDAASTEAQGAKRGQDMSPCLGFFDVKLRRISEDCI